MNETRYLISEAVKITQVEAHVLRYWEEELGLNIGRNKMGHRYYTEKDIRTFENIKELKKKGLQLRAIKDMLEQMEQTGRGDQPEDTRAELPRVIVMQPQKLLETEEKRTAKEMVKEADKPSECAVDRPQDSLARRTGKKYGREKRTAVNPAGNRKTVGKQEPAVKSSVNKAETIEKTKEERFGEIMERLIKDIERSEKKEGRYRRLDEAIRKHQQSRKMVAATEENTKRKSKEKKKK